MPSILIVDSDLAARAAFKAALRRDSDIAVVGESEATSAVIDRIGRLAPDMVVLGLAKHELDLAARIMREAPRPLLLLTSEPRPDSAFAARALGVGALEVQPKLPAPAHADYEKRRAMLARLIRVLAKVPVVTRVSSGCGCSAPRLANEARGVPAGARPARSPRAARSPPEVLVMGASTGGPAVLAAILNGLPNPYPSPIAVVQHMTRGFNREFVHWLGETTGRRAVIVEERAFLEPGVLYFAADDRHLIFTSRFELASSSAGLRRFERPSIDVLFETAAESFGGRSTAVLLTGMGFDGVEGMAALKRRGAFTLAQSPESCAVDSMPRGAIERELVDVVADPEGIAAALAEQIVRQPRVPEG